MADVDAIVIGAGHNGLVAANALADSGWSVVVLEAGSEPGGAVRSAELAAPGFRTDVCASFLPFAAASPLLRRLGLADYGVEWRRSPRVLTHLLPDGGAATLSPDPGATAESLDAFAAGDGDRWLELYREWEAFGPAVMQALFAPFPPVAAVGHLAGRLPLARALRLARQGLLPARRFGQELFDGEGARALLAGCSLHTDLGPDDAGGGVFGWLLTMLGQQVGFPTVAGGVGRLTEALVARLREQGGEVVCSTAVERVLVRGSRAVGVRTAAGEELLARRAVIADVSAPALYGGLVADRYLPERLVADVSRFAWDHAVLKVDWAVEGSVPWVSSEAREAAVVHLGGDVNGLARYAGKLANRETPEDPFLVVGQLTTADPSRSPAGTETLWAYTHLPHEAGRGHDFEAVAMQVERMENQIERYAPGFRMRIRDRFVADPGDKERGNPNLFGGAINGGSAAIHQQLVFRPTPGLGRADTPIDRLYLASSSAHPSGGVHGGPGANAARAALARSRRATGWLYGAGVRAANVVVFGRD